MSTVKTVLTVIFIIVCLILTVVVLLQEGKSSGLGVVSGGEDTYWSKNKGNSLEGKLEKATKLLVFLFLALALALNIMK